MPIITTIDITIVVILTSVIIVARGRTRHVIAVATINVVIVMTIPLVHHPMRLV